MAEEGAIIEVIDLEPVKILIQTMIAEFDSLPPGVQLKLYALAADEDIELSEVANTNSAQTQRN